MSFYDNYFFYFENINVLVLLILAVLYLATIFIRSQNKSFPRENPQFANYFLIKLGVNWTRFFIRIFSPKEKAK